MVVAVALAGQEDMTTGDPKAAEHLILDVFVCLVLDHELAEGRERVAHIDAQMILMTVHRDDSHLRGVLRRQDTGNIAVRLQRQLELARLMALDVVAHDADL